MKHRYPILLLLSIGLLASACNRHSAVETAALEVYNRYATHSDQLTVAYVGDYHADGQVYTGVLLQAQTDEMWQWLRSEFGIIEYSMEDMSSFEQVVPLQALHTNSLVLSPQMSVGLDSIQLEQLVLDAAQGIMDQLFSDTTDSMAVKFMVLDPTMLPSDSTGFQQMIASQQQILALSHQHDDEGYVMSIDHSEHIVWLFFYSSPFEREQLTRMVSLPKHMGITQ